MDSKKTSLLNKIDAVYTDYNGKTLKSPNPLNPGNVNSLFINTLLGPSSSKTTATGMMKQEIEIKVGALATVLNSLGSAVDNIKS